MQVGAANDYAAARSTRRQKQDALIGISARACARSSRCLDQRRLDLFAAPGEAFVQAVQAPHIVGMLAGAAQLAVKPRSAR